MDDLAGKYRVFALDLRGHGHSPWTKRYSFDLYADDVTGFVEALSLTGVVLVGHSLGGAAVLLAAQRRPQWLSKLVLEDHTILRPGSPPLDEEPQRPPEPLAFDGYGVVPAFVAQYNDPDPA